MLTKNFYSYIRSYFSGNDTYATFTSTEGTIQTVPASASYPPFKVMNAWSKSTTTTGVSFGTGTTLASVSDYALESRLTDSQINVSTPSAVSFSRDDAYDEYSVTFGVTNKTANDITISEIGLTAMPYFPSSGGNVYTLVDRTVLDTPVTISAGQSKQITYTIRFNYGGAV